MYTSNKMITTLCPFKDYIYDIMLIEYSSFESMIIVKDYDLQS